MKEVKKASKAATKHQDGNRNVDQYFDNASVSDDSDKDSIDDDLLEGEQT